MAQNENRDAASREDHFQNTDQTTQRRETDQQNARNANQNSRNDNNDRGISGMASTGDQDKPRSGNNNADRKADSMDLNKENTPR